MRTALTILIAGFLVGTLVPYAHAQNGVRFGMGVELQNQQHIGIDVTGGEVDIVSGGAELTPSALFTIQATSKFFLEPFIGFHRTYSSAEENTSNGLKVEYTAYNLNVGAGLMFALDPDALISPMLHAIGALTLVNGTTKVTGSGGESKEDISATAFSVGAGVGGLVNVKGGLYMTAEARFMFTFVGDTDIQSPDVPDNVDTSARMFDTDMVIGVRFVF